MRYVPLSSEYNIDGEEFVQLTRQDVALLFPNDSQFLLGMRLFRFIQGLCRKDQDDDESIELFSDDESASPKSKPAIPKSKAATPKFKAATPAENKSTPKSVATMSKSTIPTTKSTRDSATPPQSKRSGGPTLAQFKLPKFDPDLETALQNDAVYNPHKRAKIIRKACEALLGFHRENETEVTTTSQEELAEVLLERAPQSLSDPAKISKDPAVGIYRCECTY